MSKTSSSPRLSASDRREAIIQEAAFVFAERGFAGATTQAIASRANVSEALLYRHFESKEALYRAVLRYLTLQQDHMINDLVQLPVDITPDAPASERGARLLIERMRRYLKACMELREDDAVMTAVRVKTASLAADGNYARHIYRRALRKRRVFLHAVLAEAKAVGDIEGTPIDANNVALFVDHIGTMLSLRKLAKREIIPYEGDDAALLDQAVLFCIRGLGLPERLIDV